MNNSKQQKQLQQRGCKTFCCSCRFSVSSTEEAESSSASDRFPSVSSLAHAMVQERLDQMIRARHVERRRQHDREGTKFVVMVAMEKSSYDPREDFRESMMEMITAKHLQDAKDLRSLLNYYISMNSDEYHSLILEVFHEVCTSLFLSSLPVLRDMVRVYKLDVLFLSEALVQASRIEEIRVGSGYQRAFTVDGGRSRWRIGDDEVGGEGRKLKSRFREDINSCKKDLEALIHLSEQNCISDDDNCMLIAPFSKDEFKVALFQMHPDKSSRPDGLNTAFYQRFWSLFGDEVSAKCVKWLDEGSFLQKINDTNIVLVPKCDQPTSMKDLRLKSLCNVIYKILSKALLNRLKKVIGRCISEQQYAFIQGKSMLDNALIANEVIHHMKCKVRGKQGEIALKKEIIKAYDRVQWNVDQASKEDILQMLGVGEGQMTGHYLGLPAVIGRNKRSAFRSGHRGIHWMDWHKLGSSQGTWRNRF
ncbi:putative transcription repressor OFP9 [Glycine soja]|uniref:Putative transcription repressor OFP9 n=1 Tax=Glycine soja TaxID=3848 RepID=A0A445G048_GLYSO|nr:putative transcription repressor OFP9 [Glycine soja]